MKKWLKRGFILFFSLLVIGWVVLFFTVRPSLDRDWTNDRKILSHTTFNENGTVSVANIRNTDYETTSSYKTSYYNGEYDPEKIIRAWFIIEPFDSIGAAHTFVSFEFEDGRFLSVSAEIRTEKGESFSPIKGLFRQYELIYVVADERDVIRLRTNYRKNHVLLYPLRGDKEKIQGVFLDMLNRANNLSERPEMYNTLTSNCTTNIINHVQKFSDKPLPWWDFRYLLPATIDSLAYDVGLIDTELSLEDARNHFFITDRAQQHDKDPKFSKLIREFGK